MNKTYIFHHDDLDGKISALIFENKYSNTETISCSYEGELINPLDFIQKDDFVIILDYSFSYKIMKQLFLFLKDNLIWIDHHVSAINNSKQYSYDKIRGIRKIGYCGAELSWKWCYSNEDCPELIEYIGDFDTFRNYGTQEFKIALQLFYGINSYDFYSLQKTIFYYCNNDLDYANRYFEMFLKAGRIVYNYKLNEYKEMGEKYSYVRKIWELDVLCMNTFDSGLCLQLPKIYNPNKHDIILTYNYNGEKWCYGLYTERKDIDVSIIAKSYGGGGHKGAAGFVMDKLLDKLK